MEAKPRRLCSGYNCASARCTLWGLRWSHGRRGLVLASHTDAKMTARDFRLVALAVSFEASRLPASTASDDALGPRHEHASVLGSFEMQSTKTT